MLSQGVLPNGSIVAVKRILLNIYTVDDSKFNGEVTNLLRIIDHPNVVRFLGFCSSTDVEKVTKIGSQSIILAQKRERLLCFEYISNGSLDKHITDELRGLEWNTRYEIISGICEGLQYLHEGKRIIHMDLKPGNIMVDSHMVPKITDFGLSRPDEKSRTTGDRFGSWGYCAPEYNNNGITTLKCDMYSLGVIITELVTGRMGIPDINYVLRRWRHRWSKLPRQHQQANACQVTKCIEIAKVCMKNEPKERPSISDIIRSLNEIRNLDCHMGGQVSPSLDDMLGIEPLELRFAFEPHKEISCDIELTNGTGNCIAFDIEMPSQFSTQPSKGIVQPRSKRAVKITLQAQEMTPGKHHPDEFIVKSIKVERGLEDKNITELMFNNEADKVVDEVNLTVVYDVTEKSRVDLSLDSLDESNVPVPKDIDYSSYQEPRGQRTTRLNFHPPQISSATNVVRYSYPRRESARAVDLMTGAMGNLLPKLGRLLKQGHNRLQTSMKKDFESLERQLRRMQATLCKVSQAQQDQLDPEDRHWAYEVRELSYDIEDVVDDLLLRIIEGSEPFTNTNNDDFGGLKETIEDIKDRVKEVTPWKVSDFVATTGVADDPRLLALYKDHKDLVGIAGPRDVLAKWLIGGDGGVSKQQLKIISIFGPGGLGKTTLAKAVYDRLHAEFNLKAFVSVGRNPDMKEVLGGILLKLDKESYADIHNKRWKQENLIDELRVVLKYKRYLIVIDDIWDIASWEIIKNALIYNDQGSRIITTSRSFEVAENSGEVCELKPLSDDHSMELFNARLFGHKGTLDPPDEQFTKVLKKCGGVPLAIITLASLLACKPREDWPKVYSSIGFGNEDNIYRVVENTRKILLFSYYDLPCYLKTCLLYLSIFPEDHEIEKDTLVWKWVAEDFVHEEPGKTLFKVGERYFNELINRCMIQPVGGESDSYTIYACRVHDMVLDMIYSVAKEENFVAILDCDDQNLSSERNVRRLAVHKRVVEQHDLANTSTCKPKVRSFNATRCCLSMMQLLPSFHVLRVLSIEDCTFIGDNSRSREEEMEEEVQQLTEDHPHLLKNNLVGLFHLRYLGLYRTPGCELPMQIGNLRFLQTLDLRGAGVKILPQSLIQLRQLKCLRSEDLPRRLPEGMGNLTCLEDLRLRDVVDSPNFVLELGNLTELRVLHITTRMFSDSLNTALVNSLSKLQKIEELMLRDGGGCNEPNWDGFSPCRRLCNLQLHNISRSRGLPVWINPSVLPNLAKLNVSVKSAKARDLDILGTFQELRYLCLFVNEDRVFPDAIAAGAFPRLRYYYMYSPLTYLPGAMPCLESVRFSIDVKAFKDANFDLDLDSFKYLPLLEKVHAQIYRWDVTVKEADEVEVAVRRAVNNHSNRPILILEHVGSSTDETPVCPWEDDYNSSSGSEQIDVYNQEVEKPSDPIDNDEVKTQSPSQDVSTSEDDSTSDDIHETLRTIEPSLLNRKYTFVALLVLLAAVVVFLLHEDGGPV
ncbi:disease resistance protein RGA5-like isoform X2 [Miscanthus floridulus]|uniref:disease resistance protein RGA5-like isoform X2 n=1 Tax=Miscanthus floridulus TaxID=154761 RepID=UPI003459A308